MPKKVRSTIGCKRAQKKKVEQPEAVAEESDDVEEDEDGEKEDPLPPEPSDGSLSEPAGAQEPTLELVQGELDEAMHKAEVVHRRWKKTLDTYFNDDNGGFLWKEDSVVERNLARLKQMDEERDAALDFAQYKIREHRMTKTWFILSRYCRRFYMDASYARQRDLAHERLLKHRRSILEDGHREPRPERDLSVEGQMELLIRKVGMVKAIQWVHVRDLRAAKYWSN